MAHYYYRRIAMKAVLTKIITALFVVAALAGCATVGEQESAIDWLDRSVDVSSGEGQ
jgi:hypothetical protein